MDGFDIPWFGWEGKQWPEGVFECIGYKGSPGEVPLLHGVHYIPERGSYLNLSDDERLQVWSKEAFRLDSKQAILDPKIYGQEVYVKDDLDNLGY
jgi:hypothetical protein